MLTASCRACLWSITWPDDEDENFYALAQEHSDDKHVVDINWHSE